MSDLPEGWAQTTLDQVAQWGSGGTPSRSHPEYFGGAIPWIKTGELGKGLITDSEERITPKGLKNSSAKLFPKGSVALAMYGATIGKASILGIDAATNQACAVGVPISELTTSEFLLHYLLSQERQFVEKGQGGAQPNISQGIVKSWLIPLPPLAEQKRISAKLELLLARVNSCRERLQRVPQILKRFREAVLKAAVTGRLTEEWRNDGRRLTKSLHLGEERIDVPESWSNKVLGELIDPQRPLCYGVVQPGPEDSAGIPLVRVQDIERGKIAVSELRTISAEVDREYQRSRLQAGDLLISVVGTIGRTAVVPAGLEANIARAIARVTPKAEVVGRWLEIWLNSAPLQWWLVRNAKEVARKTLNLSDLGKVPVAVPSRPEQQEIARRVGDLFSLADALERRHTVAVEHVDNLAPGLLGKAFRGELAPQDPHDEPAEKMLERIHAERERLGESFRQLRAPPGHPRRRKSPVSPLSRGRRVTMGKSRSDSDVKGKPYLAGILRENGSTASVEDLFSRADLPVADFYKQLVWEIDRGHIKDRKNRLEAA